ncbi:hypothetical protein ACFU6I_00500 [Streptomyces sp. NPDC057486]|uniref:hypothetical protein n=1 Tax=Streptomyces sp. NPDC057486 TaxID=3346145 RepID=UPI0036BD3A6F
MSVEPEAPEPRWAVPPVGGWTADDLDTLPNLPPHTELIDGSLVFVSPQTLFRSRAVSFFEWQLQSLVPPELLEPATGAYISTGIFHDRMKVSVPFPIDLDLTAITPRRRAADPE